MSSVCCDFQSAGVGDILRGRTGGGGILFHLFNYDKGDAVYDQRHRHGYVVVQMGIQPVVQKNTDHRRRHAGDEDHPPQTEAGFPLRRGFFRGEGEQLVEIQHHHGQNRAQLYHHTEHFHEILAQPQGKQLVIQHTQGGSGPVRRLRQRPQHPLGLGTFNGFHGFSFHRWCM